MALHERLIRFAAAYYYMDLLKTNMCLGIEDIENLILELSEEQISTSQSVLDSENLNDKKNI